MASSKEGCWSFSSAVILEADSEAVILGPESIDYIIVMTLICYFEWIGLDL